MSGTSRSCFICLYYVALKVKAVQVGDFYGVIFPDVQDVEALDMTSRPARVSYLPPIKRSDIPSNIRAGETGSTTSINN